ncbi:transposase domain-containing protein [Streptomyces sp. NPDC005574]|uniref:transposase domain-containing protein n=1 Tax=Streptomyces sp. NPDC005574 TaxID=3156891 RepID=UPI0033B55B86
MKIIGGPVAGAVCHHTRPGEGPGGPRSGALGRADRGLRPGGRGARRDRRSGEAGAAVARARHVYFVLALALFEHCSYRVVWGKLTAQLPATVLVRPAVPSLVRARRRLGARPLKVLFQTLAGPVGERGRPGVLYRGLRTVAVDGTCLHVPEDEQVTWRYPKRAGEYREFGYPLLRLLVVVECGTRALLAAAFGPETDGETDGETAYAARLLGCLDALMPQRLDAAPGRHRLRLP